MTHIRKYLVASSMLTGVLLCAGAGAATAQTTDQTTVAQDVVVTGSRIARREADASQPTSVITSKQVENSGLINLGNVLRESPLFQAYDQRTGDRVNTTNGGNAGVTFPNLYGLGAQRTLTLVDGKRAVGAASASGAGSSGLQVDVSAIPTGLVDRIETISVGGAPIYGSDAIAGTVNIILKKNFEGLNFDGQEGVTQKGDGWNGRAQLLAGKNFDGGRGNITASVAYARQDGISAYDRDFNVPGGLINPIGNTSQFVPVYNAGYIFSSHYGTPSSFFGIAGANPTTLAPFGFYTDAGGNPLRFDKTGNLVPFSLGKPAGAVVLGAALITVLPSSDTDTTRIINPIVSQSSRTFLNLMGHYDITPHVRAFGRVSYTRTGSHFGGNEGAPLSSALGATALTYSQFYSTSNPFLLPATRAYFTANPTIYTGSSFYLNREYNDVTDGAVDIKQDTWMAQGGLEGDFSAFNRTFKWDLTLSQGRTHRSYKSIAMLAQQFSYAEDAVLANSTLTAIVPTPANTDYTTFTYDPTSHTYKQAGTGNVIACRIRVAGLAGTAAASDVANCAPFNPFGQSNPQDALNYLRGQASQTYGVDQQYAQGNVNGQLFRLPAGSVEVAAGFELRHEHANYNLDRNSATGAFLGGSTGAPVSGGFTTKEVYTELRAPLLTGDMVQKAIGSRILERVEFDGAVRYMDNTIAGSDITWTSGSRVVFSKDLLVRANLTHSVRQPSIAELYAGVIPQFTSVSDPCSTALIGTGPNPSVRRANCEQLVINAGIASTKAAADTFLASYTSPLGGIAGQFAGNRNLKSETANSWTAGAVLTPSFIPNLTLTVDYISIHIHNEIAALNGSGVAANCVDNAGGVNNFYCAAVPRAGPSATTPFRITSFTAFQANIDEHEFAGVTLNGRYKTDLGSWFGRPSAYGQLAFDTTMFWLDHDRDGMNGQLVKNTGAVGYERYRAQYALDWTYRNFGARVQETYYSSAKMDPNSTQFLYNNIPSYALTDLSLRYALTPKIRVSFIVNNLFDKAAPFQTFSYQYDRIGRRYMAGLNYTF